MKPELTINTQSSIGSQNAALPSGLTGKGGVILTVAISQFMRFVGKSLLGITALGGMAAVDEQLDLGLALQKARAELVFFDSMGSEVGSEAFPNLLGTNSASSAVLLTLGSDRPYFDHDIIINSLSYRLGTSGGFIDNIDFHRIGVITGNPLDYDGVAHGNSGLGGYSLFEQEVQINYSAPNFSHNFVGQHAINGSVINIYDVTFSSLELEISANQIVSFGMMANSNNNVFPVMTLNGNAFDDLGYFKATSDFTSPISDFGFLSGNNTQAQWRSAGDLATSVPEPSFGLLLGAVSACYIMWSRKRCGH